MTTRTARGLSALVAAGAILAAVPACRGGGMPAETRRWLAHVKYLSSDAMRGRQTGSPEHRTAAQYVAAQFEELGLQPGAGEGFLQPVGFIARRVREKDCALDLVFGDRVVPLTLGEDATLQMSVDSDSLLEAKAVFVGYGLSVPEAGYDDLAGTDLTGKIAVLLQGGPSAVKEPLRSYAQSTGARWSRLHEHGAIGLVTISNPHHSDIPWLRGASQRFSPGMVLADSTLDERRGQRLGVSFNPDRANKLFEGTPHNMAELLALADSQVTLPVFPLVPKIRARVHYDRETLESQNVVALLPGSDPALKDEIVLLTAHLDHLGVGAPVAGDSIYNGAMDNASGVAALIEIARALTKAPKRPARTVAFVCVTGEEKGLLGSRYFTDHLPMRRDRVIANINLDQVRPLFPLKLMTAIAVDESTLGDTIRAVAGGMGLRIQADPEPWRNLMRRADNWSFMQIGVPATGFVLAPEKDTPDDAAYKEWYARRYHTPLDDLDQPWVPSAAAAFNDFFGRLVAALANAERRPQWKAGSEYAKPSR